MAGAASGAWVLARAQHGVLSRRQLLALGLTKAGIEHRVARGRLHPVERGVYALGRPGLTLNGRRMSAILASGGDLDATGAVHLRPGPSSAPAVVLSHDSAADLLAIGREPVSHIEISTTLPTDRRIPGVKLHRRPTLGAMQSATAKGSR